MFYCFTFLQGLISHSLELIFLSSITIHSRYLFIYFILINLCNPLITYLIKSALSSIPCNLLLVSQGCIFFFFSFFQAFSKSFFLLLFLCKISVIQNLFIIAHNCLGIFNLAEMCFGFILIWGQFWEENFQQLKCFDSIFQIYIYFICGLLFSAHFKITYISQNRSVMYMQIRGVGSGQLPGFFSSGASFSSGRVKCNF